MSYCQASRNLRIWGYYWKCWWFVKTSKYPFSASKSKKYGIEGKKKFLTSLSPLLIIFMSPRHLENSLRSMLILVLSWLLVPLKNGSLAWHDWREGVVRRPRTVEKNVRSVGVSTLMRFWSHLKAAFVIYLERLSKLNESSGSWAIRRASKSILPSPMYDAKHPTQLLLNRFKTFFDHMWDHKENLTKLPQ